MPPATSQAPRAATCGWYRPTSWWSDPKLHPSPDAHQFCNCQGRMRIIELNGGFLRQLSPIAVVPEKPADQICQRTSDQKIFLHKAQLLPSGCRVIGIEHSGQRFGFE